jgi:hypothetical protein
MPVPKGKEKLYGKIVGVNINRGRSLAAAKDIADRAVDAPAKRSKLSKRKKF